MADTHSTEMCCLCKEEVDTDCQQAVRLTCRLCDTLVLHVDCHMKFMKANPKITCIDMAKAGHAANFDCPRPGCKGKIKDVKWMDGKRNEKKKAARIQAAIMANQFRAKPPKPPKPDPAAKEAKAKAEADAKAAAKKAQGPQPVVRVPSRGADVAPSPSKKMTPAQEAAMTKLMRERAAAIRAEMGKGVGPSNGSAAAPATGSTALTTQPISVLAKRPAPAVAGVSASQPGGSWATKAAPAAPPGQSLADRLGIGTVSGGIREDLEELIPGAVFVERKAKKKRGGGPITTTTAAAAGGGKAAGRASVLSPRSPSEDGSEPVKPAGGRASAHGFTEAGEQLLQRAAQKAGHIRAAEQYAQLLRSLGMKIGSDNDDDDDDDDDDDEDSDDDGDDNGQEGQENGEAGQGDGVATAQEGQDFGLEAPHAANSVYADYLEAQMQQKDEGGWAVAGAKPVKPKPETLPPVVPAAPAVQPLISGTSAPRPLTTLSSDGFGQSSWSTRANGNHHSSAALARPAGSTQGLAAWGVKAPSPAGQFAAAGQLATTGDIGEEDEDPDLRAAIQDSLRLAAMQEAQQPSSAFPPLPSPAAAPAPAAAPSVPTFELDNGVEFGLHMKVEAWLAERDGMDDDGIAWFRDGLTWTACLPDGDIVPCKGMPVKLRDAYFSSTDPPVPTSVPASILSQQVHPQPQARSTTPSGAPAGASRTTQQQQQQPYGVPAVQILPAAVQPQAAPQPQAPQPQVFAAPAQPASTTVPAAAPSAAPIAAASAQGSASTQGSIPAQGSVLATGSVTTAPSTLQQSSLSSLPAAVVSQSLFSGGPSLLAGAAGFAGAGLQLASSLPQQHPVSLFSGAPSVTSTLAAPVQAATPGSKLAHLFPAAGGQAQAAWDPKAFLQQQLAAAGAANGGSLAQQGSQSVGGATGAISGAEGTGASTLQAYQQQLAAAAGAGAVVNGASNGQQGSQPLGGRSTGATSSKAGGLLQGNQSVGGTISAIGSTGRTAASMLQAYQQQLQQQQPAQQQQQLHVVPPQASQQEAPQRQVQQAFYGSSSLFSGGGLPNGSASTVQQVAPTPGATLFTGGTTSGLYSTPAGGGLGLAQFPGSNLMYASSNGGAAGRAVSLIAPQLQALGQQQQQQRQVQSLGQGLQGLPAAQPSVHQQIHQQLLQQQAAFQQAYAQQRQVHAQQGSGGLALQQQQQQPAAAQVAPVSQVAAAPAGPVSQKAARAEDDLNELMDLLCVS